MLFNYFDDIYLVDVIHRGYCNEIIDDEVYNRIVKKIEDGTFVVGKDCKLVGYYFEGKTIHDFPLSERTPVVCSALLNYGQCSFSDVPKSSRTREFYISNFTNNEVYDYIKNHISDFDRQFFKDLLSSNEYATHFDNNCFAIMPREYIDEEMCSLAILNSLDWSDNSWFYSVCRRKKEALTEDLWKLGARLYARLSGQRNDFLIFTPVEYRNQEYYKEMCRCNFNCGMKLDTNKGKIMDSIPQEVLTVEFLLGLLQEDINSVARFNEKALETEISYTADGEIVCEKIWQFVVRNAGDTIRNIELNDERVEYFLCYYDEHSREYRFCFADKYKKLKAIDGNKKLLLKKN